MEAPAKLAWLFPDSDTIPDKWAPRFGASYWEPLPPMAEGSHFAQCPAVTVAGVGTGLFVALGDFGGAVGVDALLDSDGMTWTDVGGGAHVGVHRDFDPMHWIRARVHATTECVLRVDGRDWFLPVADISLASLSLPCVDRFERGEWVSRPLPAYKRLADYAVEAYRVELGEIEQPADPWAREVAVCALQCNYALTDVELACIGVMNQDAYAVARWIITDAEARKKKAPSG